MFKINSLLIILSPLNVTLGSRLNENTGQTVTLAYNSSLTLFVIVSNNKGVMQLKQGHVHI